MYLQDKRANIFTHSYVRNPIYREKKRVSEYAYALCREERGRRRAYAQKNTGSERQAAALKKAITIKYVRACAHELRDICLLPLQSPRLYDIIGDGGKI